MTPIVLAAATAFFLTALHRARLAFFIFVGAIPFMPRYITLAIGQEGLALSLRRLMVYALFLSIIIRALRNINYLRLPQWNLKEFRYFVIALIFLYITKFISTLNTSGPPMLIYWVDEALAVFVALFLASKLITTSAELKIWAGTLTIATLAVYAISIPEYIIQKPLLQGIIPIEITTTTGREILEGRYREGYRISGLFDNPIPLAEYLCFSVAAFLAWRGLHTRLSTNHALLFIIAGFMAVVATGSRSGAMVYVITLLLGLYLHLGLRVDHALRQAQIFLLGAIVTLMAWAGYYSITNPDWFIELTSAFFQYSTQHILSTYERADQFRTASEAIAATPLIGIGMMRLLAEQVEEINRLDNYILRTMIESGILGMTLFLTQIFIATRAGLRIRKNNRLSIKQRRVANWIITAFIVLALFKLFTANPGNNLYLYMTAAIIFSIHYHQQTFFNHPTRR